MLMSKLTVHMLKCIVRGHICCPLIHDSSFIHSFNYINLTKPTSHNNLTKLTRKPNYYHRPKLDHIKPFMSTRNWTGVRIILQLKNLFKERNIPYPLIYNSYDLLLMLDKLHITNMYDLCLTTLTSHPFTPTYHTMTLLEPSSWAANCLICLTFIGTIYLTSIKTKLFYCWW